MDKVELEARTKGFAVQVIRFVAAMPRSKVADVLGRQLLRAGTSIGANYRQRIWDWGLRIADCMQRAGT